MRKKRVFIKKFSEAMRFVAVMTMIVFVTQSGVVWAAAIAPLSTATNPVFGTTGANVGKPPATASLPNGLPTYVKDVNAAIMLGKALFWDMQVGGDGIQACASCHHRAGVDPLKHEVANVGDDPLQAEIRDVNQLNPGVGGFDAGLKGANTILNNSLDLPFLSLAALTPRTSPTANTFAAPIPGINDVVGSQGVLNITFTDIKIGSRIDSGTLFADSVFTSGGSNVRQVTGRNTPPTVNAVFNFANFWDGRAHNIFNGSSPFGPLEPDVPGIFITGNAGQETPLVNQKVAIPNASLASQAVGPPNNSVEMSFAGRSFPQLGRKMLSLAPLAIQTVAPNDSVLGAVSNYNAGGRGITVTNPATGATGYKAMIQLAFQDNLWNSNALVTAPGQAFGFTQMEANFSLFWGLSVMLYEATLVSDQTPFDLDPTVATFVSTVRPAGTASQGLAVFNATCAVCHSGAEMTLASVSNTNAVGLYNLGRVSANQGTDINDTGFMNIGVRPTDEDKGRGNTGGHFGLPLAFTNQALSGITTTVPLPAPATALPAGRTTSRVDATFKIPSLRNIALSGPYFHNGSVDTLNDVIEVYRHGGDFDNLERSIDTQCNGIGTGAGAQRDDLVALMDAFTDPRVKAESAPFDHPELIIPAGAPEFGHMIRKPARGADGAVIAAPLSTVTATVPATTNRGHPVINGEKEAGADVTISVNGTAAVTPDIVTDTTFTTTLTGLHAGNNTVTITATDMTGGVTTVNKAIVVAFPSGVLTGGTAASVNDALRALKIALGLIAPAASDLANGDVAPVVGGLPNPDGQINVADAVVILRLAVGLEQF